MQGAFANTRTIELYVTNQFFLHLQPAALHLLHPVQLPPPPHAPSKINCQNLPSLPLTLLTVKSFVKEYNKIFLLALFFTARGCEIC